jgi:hypothetical protein
MLTARKKATIFDLSAMSRLQKMGGEHYCISSPAKAMIDAAKLPFAAD